jgi:hypothetical protein
MSSVAPRRTFGLKNAALKVIVAVPAKSKKRSGFQINPLILAGGGAFLILAVAVTLLDSAASPPPGGPVITEVRPDSAAAQPSAAKPAVGGKLGPAASAFNNNR